MIYKAYYSDELYHHGIKGQKWGVRRYQNKDGTRTRAGKRHRYWTEYVNSDGTLKEEKIKKYLADEERQARLLSYRPDNKEDLNKLRELLKDKDISFDENGAILSKGSELNRYTIGEEAIDNTRKYVSITDNDKKIYEKGIIENTLGGWDKDNPDEVYEQSGQKYLDVLETTKDIKIANASTAYNELINSYGNVKVSELANSYFLNTFDYSDDIGKVPLSSIHKDPYRIKYIPDSKFSIKAKKNTNLEKILIGRTLAGEQAIEKLLNRKYIAAAPDEKNNPYISNLKSKGYDAVVDLQDLGYADYPILLLNPEGSVKRKRRSAI